jgi:hypothetical protein
MTAAKIRSVLRRARIPFGIKAGLHLLLSACHLSIDAPLYEGQFDICSAGADQFFSQFYRPDPSRAGNQGTAGILHRDLPFSLCWHAKQMA